MIYKERGFFWLVVLELVSPRSGAVSDEDLVLLQIMAESRRVSGCQGKREKGA